MSTPRLLNQKAINDLFAIGPEAENTVGNELEVEPYNFFRPPRIPRKAQIALDAATKTFLQKLEKALSLKLRNQTSLSETGMETVFFSELALSLGFPGAAFLFPVGKAGKYTGLFDWGIDGSLAIVDRLMGGPGQAGTTRRPLTAIERGILQVTTEQALAVLSDAWKDLLVLGREVTGFEPDPPHSELTRPEDRFLVTFVRMAWEGFEETVTVALPYAAVAPVIEKSRTKPGASLSPSTPDSLLTVLDKNNVKYSHVTLSARLPEVALTVREISRLREGQIIDLGHGQDSPMHVHVNGKLFFLGSAGEVRGHLGVRIVEKASIQVPERLTHTTKGRVL